MQTPLALTSRAINAMAAFLSTAHGFILIVIALLVGIGVGAMLQFSEGFLWGFNILLSVTAIAFSCIILVSAARSEAALHVKLDHLIEQSRATNDAIGLEHKEIEEIERERERVERHVAGEAIDEAVEEEVTEQLDARGVSRATSGP